MSKLGPISHFLSLVLRGLRCEWGAGVLNLVLSLSLSHTGHWKFNMLPHGKELSVCLNKIIVAIHKDGVGYNISRLAVNRGSRFRFHSPPYPFFPPCWLLLSRLIYWRDSFCTALQTRKLWIWSTGLSARLTPSSQREVWVLGNLFVLTGRSRPDIRGMRGRSGKSYVWRLCPWRTLRISTFSAPW